MDRSIGRRIHASSRARMQSSVGAKFALIAGDRTTRRRRRTPRARAIDDAPDSGRGFARSFPSPRCFGAPNIASRARAWWSREGARCANAETTRRNFAGIARRGRRAVGAHASRRQGGKNRTNWEVPRSVAAQRARTPRASNAVVAREEVFLRRGDSSASPSRAPPRSASVLAPPIVDRRSFQQPTDRCGGRREGAKKKEEIQSDQRRDGVLAARARVAAMVVPLARYLELLVENVLRLRDHGRVEDSSRVAPRLPREARRRVDVHIERIRIPTRGAAQLPRRARAPARRGRGRARLWGRVHVRGRNLGASRGAAAVSRRGGALQVPRRRDGILWSDHGETDCFPYDRVRVVHAVP